jgi:quercetin dioxygenase-like cupin family protein
MSSNNEHLWFLNTLVQIRVSYTQGTDGLSVFEHRVPHGDSPPLHSHRTEDEFFYVLEGEFLFQLDDTQFHLEAGAMLLAPKGSVHSYRAESKAGGRFVTVLRGGDFERCVRAMSRPAVRAELPPVPGPPTTESLASLTKLAAAHGIVIHGPPMQ